MPLLHARRAGRRAVALLVSVTAAVLVCLATAGPASAHPLNTSTVRLDVGVTSVAATVDLPLDQLGIAMGHELTPTGVLDSGTLSGLRSYLQQHLSATDSSGRVWRTVVGGGRVEVVDGADNLVLEATLTPSSGPVGDFVLHDDAVIDELMSHRVFVSGRYGTTGAYTTLAMLSWQTTSVPVAAVVPGTTSVPSAAQGFVSAVHLGVEHISDGSDHLLFLLMLLLPAPLVAAGRTWVPRRDTARAARRVVHVVSAFAVGHSITLVLGTLGWVHLATRLVESGIALSVLVSAIHALRPLVRRGEVLIAGSFGLLHGMAFATLLGELDLSRTSLVSTLLGFNLGIEITQLLVVVLVMPSLVVISRTAAYPALRVTTAGLGAVLATAWFAERVGLLAVDPLEPVGNVLVDQPLALAAGLAAAAAGCALLGRRRRTADPQGEHAELPGRAPTVDLEHTVGSRS